MITIKDVAKAAGVSVSTVSVVLGNRSSHVSIGETTRELVRETARKLGYRRNALAAQMITGKSNVVAFVGGSFNFEYVFRLVNGALDLLGDNDFTLKIVAIDTDTRPRVDHLLEARPQGLIFRQGSDDAADYVFEVARECSIPVVAISPKRRDWPLIVDSHDELGAELLVDHLLGLGHRRVAVVNCGGFLFGERRLAGVEGRLRHHGLELDPELVFTASCLDAFNVELAAFIHRVMGSDKAPTAFCGLADDLASRTFATLLTQGFKIPSQAVVTGFGGIKYLCEGLVPGLTTVSESFELMGEEAARQLVRAIRGEAFEPRVLVSPTLSVRGSTDPAAT